MKTFYIETYGCQMNKYDSELMAGILSGTGYRPAANLDEADIVLLNTCSVRDRAEQRVFGRLGELKRLKDRNPEVIIGLCGCMAQRVGKGITAKAAHVDLVIGPDGYCRLPEVIEHLNGQQAFELDLDATQTYSKVFPLRREPLKAWVAIMRGCNNSCSYCIVPSVRGSARSRPVDDIIGEINALIRDGYKEVTLLGQNVNAYSWKGSGFAELLAMVDALDGLERIRFTTSHPKDMSPAIIQAMAQGKNICEHLHLPVQSGSTRILRAMNRGYTAEAYVRLVHSIRERIPGVSITTDLIVGFPGETEKEYQHTLELVRTVGFDSAFTFRYSPRPGTRAAGWEDDVSEHEKRERLEHLIAVQRSVTDQKNKQLIHQKVEVFVEGESRKGGGQLVGRTRTDKTVVFDGESNSIGSCLWVRVVKAKGWTLWGHPIDRS
jgi:tRNA-2-methylthio-N6-dimethylallyladenosine synthase